MSMLAAPSPLSRSDLHSWLLSASPEEVEAAWAVRTGTATPLDLMRLDRTQAFSLAGLDPDPWQADLLNATADLQMLLLCTRQAGKSTLAAGLALLEAFLNKTALVLLLSPSQRQSGELFRDKVLRLYNALGRPIPATQESALQMTLANGSRIVSLPGDEETIRGFSGVRLLVIDEASRVPDDLYRTVRPMLAVSRGRLICLSTPFGKRGWFFEEWEGRNSWKRVRITAHQCPRISPDFLTEERRSMPDRWFRQEYECVFEDAIDSVFAQADIDAAIDYDARPLFAR